MDARVRDVIAFMRANLNRQISVSEMAASVQLSASHLRQLFKTETGTSFARYLKGLRMQRAKELLETTFLSVKQVATEVRIASISHFVADFKKACGTTPSQYAGRYQRIHKPHANH